MRLIKKYNFAGINGYKLGWSLLGPPLMTTYCYTFGEFMIDTGQSHMQREVLDIALMQKIKRIALTHHHEDHSGNAAAIYLKTRAQVYGHSLTKMKMAEPFSILPYQKYIWGKTTPLSIMAYPDTFATSMGTMIPIHTPGHSKDHTSFLLKDKGVLFSGDLYLADKIKFFRSDEDIGTQILSLKTIMTYDFDQLLCSHFPKAKNGKAHIKAKLLFLEEFYGNVIEYRQKGLPERVIFKLLNLKEDYFTKYFCFGNVSMLNGVRSVIRHHEAQS
jgi:glyoxylase-like metal-dependent hydrolase (beta-lactamase superfamily II)